MRNLVKSIFDSPTLQPPTKYRYIEVLVAPIISYILFISHNLLFVTVFVVFLEHDFLYLYLLCVFNEI
jgi:hypothetical protein